MPERRTSNLNVLFVGGCHAKVLAEIFAPYVNASFITNFVEIAARRAPNLDYICTHDVVVMSPVLRNEEWSSLKIRDAVSAAGKKVITYPWLEWHGYYPESKKGWMFGTANWTGVTSKNFTDYLPEQSAYNTEASIWRNFEATTETGRQNEREAGTDFGICDFILDNYRQKRLFLTPDHPSNVFYEFICREIEARLGIGVELNLGDRSEYHPELLTPISPVVREVLQLEFDGGDYLNREAFPAPLPARALAYAADTRSRDLALIQISQQTYLRDSLDEAYWSEKNKLILPGQWILAQLEDVIGGHIRITIGQSSLEDIIGSGWYVHPSHCIIKPCGYYALNEGQEAADGLEAMLGRLKGKQTLPQPLLGMPLMDDRKRGISPSFQRRFIRNDDDKPVYEIRYESAS